MAALGDKPTPILFTLTGLLRQTGEKRFWRQGARRMAVVFGEASRSKAPGGAAKARTSRRLLDPEYTVRKILDARHINHSGT
jgi:hypothetical protein